MTLTAETSSEYMPFTYRWEVDGRGTVSTESSYTPVSQDLEKFISVAVTGENHVTWTLKTYCSELPVVYAETADGQEVNSNTVAKDATIKIQGNWGLPRALRRLTRGIPCPVRLPLSKASLSP